MLGFGTVLNMKSSLERERRALLSEVGARKLQELTLIKITGEDRLSWIQGQVTNDTSHLGASAAVYALSLTAKGKVVSELWLTAHADALFAVVPEEAKASLLEHFDRQIIMEDVELEETPHLSLFTFQGPKSVSAAEMLPKEWVKYNCDRLGQGGVDVVAPQTDASSATLRQCVKNAEGLEVSEEAWEQARLEAPRARFGFDLTQETLPQEAGLRDRAISFSKGCYIGQEVVCMLENRGKLRRSLVRFKVEGSVRRGADVSLEGEPIGLITSVSPEERGGGENLALGYLPVTRILEQGAYRADDAQLIFDRTV